MPVLFPLLLLAFSTTDAQPSHAPAKYKNAACSAIKRADVEQALGVKVSEGIGEEKAGEALCDFSAPAGLVTVTVRQLAARLNLVAEIDALKAALPGSAIRDVNGIAARAFVVDIPGAGSQLHVVTDDHRYVMVSVLGFGEGTRPAAAAATLVRKLLR